MAYVIIILLNTLKVMKILQNQEMFTKAEKRETKKRPRMKMHGAGLKKLLKYAGKKLAKT